MSEKTDVMEEELREAVDLAPTPAMVDKYDTIIRMAERVETLGLALDKIRKFVLGRSLPGDWVKFGEKDKNGNLELTWPGAMRIANALGISFTNWREPWKETGVDSNGPHYSWWYMCDVTLGGRKIENVEGRAGTRNKFFGYANRAWKEMADGKEDDIKAAARHNCMKEGVRLIMGLSRIPEESATMLGLDPKNIRAVTFESAQRATEPLGMGKKFTGAITGVTGREYKPKKFIYTIACGDWKGNTFSETYKEIAIKAKGTDKKFDFSYDTSKFGNDIKEMVEAGAAPVGVAVADNLDEINDAIDQAEASRG
jgi:hypothetical protein